MEWKQICKVGEYFGHPQGGYALSQEDLDRMVLNFSKEVPIDYEHATHNPLAAMAPAAGWIKEVKREGDTLLGNTDWNERGKEMIDKREYKYLSPVIDLYAIDKESGNLIGPKLISVGLTNIPFMEELEAIQNKFLFNNQIKTTQDTINEKVNTMKKIQEVLGLPGASEDDIVSTISTLKKNKAELESQMTTINGEITKLKEADTKKEADLKDLKAKLDEKEKAVTESQELAEAEVILNKAVADGKILSEQISGKTPDETKAMKAPWIASIRANKKIFDGMPVINHQSEKEAKELAEAEAILNKAVADGKVFPAHITGNTPEETKALKAPWIASIRANKKIFDGMPVLNKLTAPVTGGGEKQNKSALKEYAETIKIK